MPLVPYFSYRDGHAALDFLERAFGFERTAAYDNADGSLQHGEVSTGDAKIMIGTAEHAAPEGLGVYVQVDDVDAHAARAKDAGAEIVFGPEDQEWGRRYRCRDLDGYEWSFGTYAP